MLQKWNALSIIAGLSLLMAGAGFASVGGSPSGTSEKSVTQDFQKVGGRWAGSLTTLYMATNGGSGNMFDITPKVTLEITAIDINADSYGDLAVVEVYYREGTCVGNENSSSGWNLLGAGTGVIQGQNNPTNIDLTGNGVLFSQGQTYGIYVHLESYLSGDTMWSTMGGPDTYANDDLELTSHCSKGYPAFYSNTHEYRIWNGTIHYDTQGDSLVVDPDTVSAQGGHCDFFLNAGQDHAFEQYLLLGSMSGTSPGTPLPDGKVLPLNWDYFTEMTVAFANLGPFVNTMGVLNHLGRAQAGLNMPGAPSSAVGLKMYFAFLCTDLAGHWFASNAVVITIVP